MSDPIRTQFDDALDTLRRRNDATCTKAGTVRDIPGLLGWQAAQTTTVQTFRAPDRHERGRDTIFVEIAAGERLTRVVLTPAVADAIARQRDALTKVSRRKAA